MRMRMREEGERLKSLQKNSTFDRQHTPFPFAAFFLPPLILSYHADYC